jgi:hypothetical protein
MEFQVGMRCFQVLSDLRVREVELVQVTEVTHVTIGIGDDRRHPFDLKFKPVSRKGPGFVSEVTSLEIPESGMLPRSIRDIFATSEEACKYALARAERNVRCKQYDLGVARKRLAKAEATLRAATKAAKGS